MYHRYGFYDHTPLNADDRYKKALMEEYTFNDPPHEDVVCTRSLLNIHQINFSV